MIKNYKIDEFNHINYRIVNNFIVIDFIHFDDPSRIFESMKNFFDYFATLDGADFLGSFPGCVNPLVVKAGLDVIKSYGFNYRIFYDKQEVEDLTVFENEVLNTYVDKCQQFIAGPTWNNTQSSCDGIIGKYAQTEGFKPCAVFSPLKKKVGYVRTPVKYYEVDSQGFLIKEYDEKPKKDNLHMSYRLTNMFQICKIKVENGSLKYFPKT